MKIVRNSKIEKIHIDIPLNICSKYKSRIMGRYRELKISFGK